jgi:hypothetical protein
VGVLKASPCAEILATNVSDIARDLNDLHSSHFASDPEWSVCDGSYTPMLVLAFYDLESIHSLREQSAC